MQNYCCDFICNAQWISALIPLVNQFKLWLIVVLNQHTHCLKVSKVDRYLLNICIHRVKYTKNKYVWWL